MVNQMYVNWLVQWIKKGTINIKTGLAFSIDDIKNVDYTTAVQTALVTEQ